jgi:hypothetical protein
LEILEEFEASKHHGFHLESAITCRGLGSEVGSNGTVNRSQACLSEGQDSLVALQEPRREVVADPAAWLPGGYARSRAAP